MSQETREREVGWAVLIGPPHTPLHPLYRRTPTSGPITHPGSGFLTALHLLEPSRINRTSVGILGPVSRCSTGDWQVQGRSHRACPARGPESSTGRSPASARLLRGQRQLVACSAHPELDGTQARSSVLCNHSWYEALHQCSPGRSRRGRPWEHTSRGCPWRHLRTLMKTSRRGAGPGQARKLQSRGRLTSALPRALLL